VSKERSLFTKQRDSSDATISAVSSSLYCISEAKPARSTMESNSVAGCGEYVPSMRRSGLNVQ
jgi:hypothetical protein